MRIRAGPDEPVRPVVRAACHPRHGQGLRRRQAGRRRPRVGSAEILSRRRAAGGGGARHGRDLCARGGRRLRPDAARCGLDLRGAGDRLPDDRGLHLHPQHGRLDDRPVRLRRAAPGLAAEAVRHGFSGELLPDRAGRRLRRGGPDHAGGAGRRRLCGRRRQAVHLRRRGVGPLPDHGPDGRRRRRRHLQLSHREGHARALLRRRGAQDGLERAADPAGHLRELPCSGRQHRSGGKAPASGSP